MTIFSLFAAAVVSLAIVTGTFQVILMIYWTLFRKSERPLLKPVALCSALAQASRGLRRCSPWNQDLLHRR